VSKHRAGDEGVELIPVPEDGEVGETINATAMIQPQSFYLHLDIDTVHVSVAVPHDKVPQLDVIVATLPSLINNALLTLRRPDEEIDDTDGS
jgi:hypothetical protein